MRAPFPDDSTLIKTIVDHLAHNRGVKLEGFRNPEVVEKLTLEYMSEHWNVHPLRRVDVHGGFFISLVTLRFLKHLAETRDKFERPLDPYRKMFHSEFIAGLSDPTRSEKVLDVPMSQRGAPPPFGYEPSDYTMINRTDTVPVLWTMDTMRGMAPPWNTNGPLDSPGTSGQI